MMNLLMIILKQSYHKAKGGIYWVHGKVLVVWGCRGASMSRRFTSGPPVCSGWDRDLELPCSPQTDSVLVRQALSWLVAEMCNSKVKTFVSAVGDLQSS